MSITRRDFLAKVGILTGSVAFGVAAHNSDEDWLIHADDFEEIGGECDDEDYIPGDGFRTARQGRLNFIVYRDQSFYERWMKAHRHCLIERPRDKKRRIKIFRHYLYGELL